jgi:glycosyltransferase involved in cell wall biosynthesis
MSDRKKILWLASWFPNRLAPLTGDFIERHAKAASLYNDVFLIHVVKDEEFVASGNMRKEENKYSEHFSAEIIYYRSSITGIDWIDAIFSNIRYCLLTRQAIRRYIRQHGKPEAIHVHIAMKAGIMAVYAKWAYQIPYLVSEQWTGLCPEAKPNLNDKSWLFRKLWRYVVRHASAVTSVSEYLATAMKQRFFIRDISIIPNVVDMSIFFPVTSGNGLFQFIHISTLNEQKNPAQLFEAISILKARSRMPFKLLVFGEPDASLRNLAERLGINDSISFKGTCLQKDLAPQMQECQALILYSRFETFGCVIIEANASGLPVIVSDIPVLHENVVDAVTGIFVPLNDPQALAEKMLWMMNHRTEFNIEQIVRLTKDKFSYPIVGMQFDAMYELVIAKGK